jgi:adenosylmethionine-8-amino-7-oxononanoate aminotransferase
MDRPSSPTLSNAHLLRPNVQGQHPVFVAGEGVELIDDQGRRYLDAASGVGVTCLGYSADEVAQAVYRQASTLQYAHSLHFGTVPMHQLGGMIAGVAPGDLDVVFFASGGSEANESAIKFVRQYWLERGRPEKWRIVGRRPSFHGNTLATLSAGWHIGRRARHAPLLLDFPHIDSPNQYRGCPRCAENGGHCTLACADELETVLAEVGAETVGAFIAEPIVGAAGGATVPPPGYFHRIQEICARNDVLFIADEVITGFGRTGRWFGVDHFEVVPDILSFAKGVSAGYAPLGGFIVSQRLIEPFRTGSGRFEHSFTMTGHPVACAAGAATLEILKRDHLVEHVAALSPTLFDSLHEALDGIGIVGDIRGLGFLAGVELVRDRATKDPFPLEAGVATRAMHLAFEEGVVVYPAGGGAVGERGDYLLLMPPFISDEPHLSEMTARLSRALRRLDRELS